MRTVFFLLTTATALSAPVWALAKPPVSGQAGFQALLATDRSFSTQARGKDLVTGLGAIFADDAVLISGASLTVIRGAGAIRDRLAANAENAGATVAWSPVGGGVSGDGSQGFTYGGMTVSPKAGAPISQKYLAYWVRRPEGWRVFAYKRAGRKGTAALTSAAPIIGRGERRHDNAATTIKAAEQAFSDEAQRIGLRTAFRKWGRPDSINIGAAETIAVGSQAISEGVAGPEMTSPVAWSADGALVAASGDMGVTYGVLRLKSPSPGQPATLPFMSIWARPRPGDPWRYVAE